MAKTKKAELAKTGTSALVEAPDYGDLEGRGFEGQTGEDIVLPFLTLLQALSPQVKDQEQGGIEGAKPGMMVNSVTGELFTGKDGVEFVPSLTQHVYVEWVPRDSGGGFVALHPLGSAMVAEAKKKAEKFGKLSTPEGHDLIETFYVYGVIIGDGGEPEPVAIAFTSTKISVYKRWNTQLHMFTLPAEGGRKIRPPLFAHRVRIKSTLQKKKSHEFFNFVMEPAEGDVRSSLLHPSDPRFKAAKDVLEMVEQGAARASYETQNAAGTDEATTAGEEPF